MGLLDGRAVVVTGAGQGLGAAYARHLASVGAAVVVNDIDPEAALTTGRTITAEGGQASVKSGDVSSWNEAKALIDDCVTRHGHIDGSVNNAGYFSMATPEDLTEAEWRRNLSVNVLGTAFCGSHAIPHMIARRRGAIVNDTSGAQFGMKYRAAYAAAKGAVASLTYTWSLELEEHGIRVNAVSPRGATQMSEVGRAFRERHGLPLDTRPSPEPAAIAPLVTFLLSDKASAVTGQVIRHEGDRLALVAHPAVMFPVVEHDQWSVDDIARAFDNCFTARLAPVGSVVVEPVYRATTDVATLWPLANLGDDDKSRANPSERTDA